MRIDFGMILEPEPLPDTKIPHTAFAMKAFGFVFMALHPQFAQPAVVVDVITDVRCLDPVVVQTEGKLVAGLALPHISGQLRRHHPALPVVPALPRNASSLQDTDSVPIDDAIARFGRGIAMKTHDAGSILGQRQGIIEQDERMDGPIRSAAVTRLAETKEPCDTPPLPQSAQEGGIRFVVLHGEFTRRIDASDTGGIDIESAGQDGIDVAPFAYQSCGNLDFIRAAKDAGIAALLHQRQRIANDQLICRQSSIALSSRSLRHDAADRAQLPSVRHKLQFYRQRDKFFQGQR
jgi:hypothetical protein